MKLEYLAVYEGVKSKILYATKFDENSDLSKTYLGRIDMTKSDKNKAEKKFPISEQGYYAIVKLLDGTKCQILLNIWASKLFMPKIAYLRCQFLHLLLKHREFR